jgi:GT2 family glycosyltransferase
MLADSVEPDLRRMLTSSSMSPDHLPALSVIIVTYRRPQFLARCLTSLWGQREHIRQLIVVDASERNDHQVVSSAYEAATYVHVPQLAGHMTSSRNEGLLYASGDVISFLDDDVVVHPGWAEAVRSAFAEEKIDALAGRTLNRVPGEDEPMEPIGSLTPAGTLTAGFAALREGRCRVTHGIGANMSFARPTLRRLGGFRDDYPGTALREDTDIFLRIARIGGVVVFDPDAAVDHLPAPHVKGSRFDTRYKLYGRRNHMVLLARHAGIGSALVRRWVASQFVDVRDAPGVRRRAERLGVTVLGVAWGMGASVRKARLAPTDPIRRDPVADRIREALKVRSP